MPLSNGSQGSCETDRQAERERERADSEEAYRVSLERSHEEP